MSKQKHRIYIKQWLELKPYDKQAPTDLYYLKLSNEVLQAIMNGNSLYTFQIYLDDDEIDLLACFLTSYFEDLISETNLWNTFIRSHKKHYGKPLPFYDTAEYYEQEINLPDICFLIWYFMHSVQEEKIIAPFNDFIIVTAERVMEVFEQAWEFAPENKLLKTFYSMDETETDYYTARNLIDKILFRSYLFYPDTYLNLADSEYEIIEENQESEHLLSFLNENRDESLQSAYTRLLALKGQEWVAELLGQEHPLSREFLQITKKIRGYFFYKGQDDENVFLEHIATGKKFDLTKKSFDHAEELKEVDTILYMGIVRWRNEWWFSGVYFQSPFNADLVLDEKNSMASRAAVNFLDHQQIDMDDILGDQLKAFLEFNHNQQIAFMASDKIEAFVNNYMEYFNKTLKLSKKEREAARQRARKEGFFGKDDHSMDLKEISDSGLVFFNPKSGLEIALAINSAFPVDGNPFYTEEESDEHIIRLLVAEEISAELVMYCVNNYKDDLKLFKTELGKLYLDNLDFLLRFWKRGNFYTRPSISFTGIEDRGS